MRSGSRRTSGISAWRLQSLHDLRIPRVRLLTNNPRKVHALSDAGIEVVEQLPCDVGPTAHSLAYLQTKKQKNGARVEPRNPRSWQRHVWDRGATVTRKD